MLVSDIDSILRTVLKHHQSTGQAFEDFIWIGHSLGAIIMYHFLNSNSFRKNYIKGFVSLAGPVSFTSISHQVIQDFKKVHSKASYLDSLYLGRLFTPLIGLVRTRFDDFLYNAQALDIKILRKFVFSATTNVEADLMNDLVRRMHGENAAKEVRLFKGIKIPTLMMTGILDNLASPYPFAMRFKEITMKTKKQLFILSKENGFQSDYCHASIVMGKNARQEVFPLVLEFLEGNNLTEKPVEPPLNMES